MDLILKSTDDLLFGMCCSRPDRAAEYRSKRVPVHEPHPFGREDEVWFKQPESMKKGSAVPSPRKRPVVVNAKPLKASQSRNGQFRGVVADMYVLEGYEAHNEILIDQVEGTNRVAIRNCNQCSVQITADVTYLILDGVRNTNVTVFGCRSVEVSKCMWVEVNFRQNHGLDPAVRLTDSFDTTFHFPSTIDVADMPQKVHATRCNGVHLKGADGTSVKVS